MNFLHSRHERRTYFSAIFLFFVLFFISLRRKMDKTEINKVREFAIGHAKLGEHTIHGIDHWDRVARNGESLNVPGADMEVVLCFAYLHDVERQSDGYDVEHGPEQANLP